MDNLSSEANWSFFKKSLFRFLFIYFVLYCFPFPIDAFVFLDPVAKPYYNFLDWLIPSIGRRWFDLNAHVAFPTFDKVDDSYYGLVFIFLLLIISFVGTLLWGVLDRRRKNYERLYQWLRLYLRYFLAAYLFGYGFIKVFPSQFQAITASRLTMPVGDQSPMLLAWNFMGYSTVMMKLTGWTEVIAGVLLFFRQTTTLGAILSAGVFSFVVMMDFCFNVPVRLLSSHLLVMSAFLVLGDLQRLMNVFVLNRPTRAAGYTPLINHPFWRKGLQGSLLLLAICLLYSTISKGLEAERSYGQSAPHGPLYGVYNTVYFVKNNDTIPPFNDSLRWKQLVIDGGIWNQSGIIKCDNDKRTTYSIEADTLKRTLRIQSIKDTTEKYFFNYSIPDTAHLLLKGAWKKDSLDVMLSKFEIDNYLLSREKFRWIED